MALQPTKPTKSANIMIEFVKATGGATWLEYSGAHGITTQIEGIFAIGCTF